MPVQRLALPHELLLRLLLPLVLLSLAQRELRRLLREQLAELLRRTL